MKSPLIQLLDYFTIRVLSKTPTSNRNKMKRNHSVNGGALIGALRARVGPLQLLRRRLKNYRSNVNNGSLTEQITVKRQSSARTFRALRDFDGVHYDVDGFRNGTYF